MTRSHAKNSATQANLSYHERSLLKREGAARRLGNESFKPLDHCNLCLVRASDPVSCSKAHIYCRECAISDLIAQKAGIEAQKRQLELWEEEDTRRKEEARAAARERVVLEFERGMGLASGGGRAAVGEKVERRGGKFQLDPEAIEKASLEAEEKASAAIAAEESEARKKKIAAFWIPQNAPEAPLGPLKGVKLQTLCHVGQVHPISLKGLLPVVFTYVGKGGPGCPSCQKELNNASGAVLITSRARVEEKGEPVKKKKKKSENGVAVCGHVVCVGCAESVVKPGMRCCVCEAQVDELLPLGKEGTGFAAAGGAEAKADIVAFRV